MGHAPFLNQFFLPSSSFMMTSPKTPVARIFRKAIASAALLALSTGLATAALLDDVSKSWTHQHSNAGGFLSEIVGFDSGSKTLWVAGVSGVDVLDAVTGSFIERIDTTAYGSINSVAIHNGIAAFAIESGVRTGPGVVKLYDTGTRSLLAGTNTITVGALPDMLTFSKDGSKLLVANEGTPGTYGARLADSNGHRNYGTPALDPVGSVSIIDMGTRTVAHTATLAGVPQTGTHVRANTGMDFEPEYIALNTAGTKAYVTLQEANAVGVLNVQTGQFEKVIGLGAKDFSQSGNRIDALNNGTIALAPANAKGLYMPDGIAVFEQQGQTYFVTANEGDFREDDGDRSAASSFGGTGALANLRVSNTDSSVGDLYAAGARSFSIRDESGDIVFDSGEILDREAIARGIYDDGRSRDKGVEPEGIELMSINGRTFAFIGLERTTKAGIAIFDITDPAHASFVDMIVSEGDVAPEGLKGYFLDGSWYLAISNEGTSTTSVYKLATAVPEPQTYAMVLSALAVLGATRSRRQQR
jgi:DNA-binding beta-propeller fold protein YncE